MKLRVTLLSFVASSSLLVGCRPDSSTVGSASTNGVTAEFEGIYFIVSRPEDIVIMTNGVYVGARASNPGGDMNGGGKYKARRIDSTTWELDMVYQEGGTGVVVVRKDGNSVWIKDKAFGGESRLKKK